MHFATIRAESLREKSTSSEQSFLDNINKQFTQLNFPGIVLQFKKTDSGIIIYADRREQVNIV